MRMLAGLERASVVYSSSRSPAGGEMVKGITPPGALVRDRQAGLWKLADEDKADGKHRCGRRRLARERDVPCAARRQRIRAADLLSGGSVRGDRRACRARSRRQPPGGGGSRARRAVAT